MDEFHFPNQYNQQFQEIWKAITQMRTDLEKMKNDIQGLKMRMGKQEYQKGERIV